jgi:hypothetical protein
MVRQHPYLSRIFSLLAITVVITIVISYIPQEFGPVRLIASLIQLGFMIVTMAIAIRYVLEDF